MSKAKQTAADKDRQRIRSCQKRIEETAPEMTEYRRVIFNAMAGARSTGADLFEQITDAVVALEKYKKLGLESDKIDAAAKLQRATENFNKGNWKKNHKPFEAFAALQNEFAHCGFRIVYGSYTPSLHPKSKPLKPKQFELDL